MSQVNLLPPEVLQTLRTRRLTILIALVGAGIVGILIFFWAIQGAKVGELDLKIQAQNATNGELTGQIDDLSDAETLQADVQASDATVSSALAGEISWWSQLRDIQLVIPNLVGLSTLSGAGGAVPPAPGASAANTIVGSVSFSGAAGSPSGSEQVARWIGHSNSIVGWANPWLTDMTESGTYTGYYTFTSTVDLTGDSLTARGQGTAEEAPA